MRNKLIFLALLCVIMVTLSGAVSAADVNSTMNTTTVPAYTNVYVQISNNVSFNYTGNNTYYIQQSGGGLNAVHLANDSSATRNTGGYTVTTNQSGTFYATDTGGRGYQDDVVLLIAVNGTIPDDFAVTITANGYNWTPTGAQSTAPVFSAISSYGTTLNETFTKGDFLYGAQNWRPSGYSSTYAYPIYLGENMTDYSNMFYLMFIDLHAGLIGSNYNGVTGGNSYFVNNGAVQINYSFKNLQSLAAFNIYAWNANTPWGAGMQWTNSINPAGTGGPSGYEVRGTSPAADFTANTTSGNNTLDVQFTDKSSNSPTSWRWNFGDGSTSTEENPTHTYTAPGNYTVTLNVSNLSGNDAVTKTSYINVLDTIAPTVNANPEGGSYNGAQNVVLAASEISDIYYTVDGTSPTRNSTRYLGPVGVSTSKTLKYAAWDAAGNESQLYTQQYNIYKSVGYTYTVKQYYKKAWYRHYYYKTYKHWYKSHGKWRYYWKHSLVYNWKYGWVYRYMTKNATKSVLN